MSRQVKVDLLAEDNAHEEFLLPVVRRVAAEEGVAVVVRVRSARGGHARAIEEFKLYQELMTKGVVAGALPDLLIVGIDGNCASFAKKRAEILTAASPSFRDRLVTACPDPHVERWFMIDPEGFHEVVGHRPNVGKKKCLRDHYKGVLASAVRQAGHPATLGGIEFAREIADRVNWYRDEERQIFQVLPR